MTQGKDRIAINGRSERSARLEVPHVGQSASKWARWALPAQVHRSCGTTTLKSNTLWPHASQCISCIPLQRLTSDQRGEQMARFLVFTRFPRLQVAYSCRLRLEAPRCGRRHAVFVCALWPLSFGFPNHVIVKKWPSGRQITERWCAPDSEGWSDFVGGQVEGEVEGGHEAAGADREASHNRLKALRSRPQIHWRILPCTSS